MLLLENILVNTYIRYFLYYYPALVMLLGHEVTALL